MPSTEHTLLTLLTTDETAPSSNPLSSSQPPIDTTRRSEVSAEPIKAMTAEERMRKLAEDARVLKEKIASLGSSAPTEMIHMLNMNADLATQALAAVEHSPTVQLSTQAANRVQAKLPRQQDPPSQRTRSSSRDRSSSSTRSVSASSDSLPGQGDMRMAVREAQRDVRNSCTWTL